MLTTAVAGVALHRPLRGVALASAVVSIGLLLRHLLARRAAGA